MSDSKSYYEVLTIESNNQKNTVDLIPGAVTFDYYEDIFSPTITAKLRIINVGNVIGGKKRQSLYNGLPLRGGERIALKILPNSKTIKSSLDFSTPKKYLYVSSITDVIADQHRESFVLHLTSREAITNETVRVYKKYGSESKISDSVKNIFKKILLSDQKLKIDDTSNVYSFIGNLRKPFTVLTWLASKSVSTKKNGKNAGYVFFQTENGFNFRSLDALIKQKPKAKYTYSQSYPSFIDNKKVDNDYKIQSHYIERNQNLIEKLRLGAFSSWRIYFNPLTFSVTEPDGGGYYDSSQYKKSIESLGGKLKLPKINSNVSLGDVPTRIVTQVLDVGTLDKKVKKGSNADPSEYQSQVLVRYNLLLTQTLNIIVPCNLDLNAGDVIECEFPQVTDSVDTKDYDEEISGAYMIKELCHHFDAESSYTSMKLVRDTFGERKK